MVRVDQAVRVRGPRRAGRPARPVRRPPQLVIHHFMWTYDFDADGVEHPREVGCPSCSSTADGIGGLGPTARAQHDARRGLARAVRRRSPRSVSGWAGGSPGTPRTAATSTTTSTPPSRPGRAGSARLPRRGRARRSRHPVDAAACAATGRASARSCAVGETVFHTYSTFGRGIDQAQHELLPRPHRARPPGGVGGTQGPRDRTREAGRRARTAIP